MNDVKMKEVYITLNEKDFRCLVRGGMLSITHSKSNVLTNICLKDIGYTSIHNAIVEAEEGKEKVYENRTREI